MCEIINSQFSLANCYIEKLEKYIEFLTETGKSDAVFLAIHGQIYSQEDFDKGEQLRNEISELKRSYESKKN